jgi:hypothetical protein
MRKLELTDFQRAYMLKIQILDRDSYGNEIMVGLTFEESLRMFGHIRRILNCDMDPNQEERADYAILYEKHESARKLTRLL